MSKTTLICNWTLCNTYI